MNSKQTISIWSRVLIQAVAGKTIADQKKIIIRLAEILKQKKKDYLLPKILEITLVQLKKNSTLKITLAHDQSKDTVDKLKKKITGEFGNFEELEVKTSPDIIGGFIAKTNEYILDASIKNYLQKLRNYYI